MRFKKLLVTLGFISFILMGIAGTTPPAKRHFKNLKVLRKNISREELDSVMNSFKPALGVKCDFCHAASKDKSEQKPDFASDEKPEKNIARKMMRMTSRLNKKYFSVGKGDKEEIIFPISCINCHHGKPDAGEKR